MDAPAIEAVVERAVAAPDREQIGGREVHGVVVTGDVDELGGGAAEDRLALGVAGAIDLEALVLDVVAEVHDQVRLDRIVHPPNEVARERRGVVAELPELAVPANLGAEMKVGDEGDGDHDFEPPRQGGETKSPAASPSAGVSARIVSAWRPALNSSASTALIFR